jgi:hypothetical protein
VIVAPQPIRHIGAREGAAIEWAAADSCAASPWLGAT